MKTIYLFLIFIVVAIIQICIPAKMIFDQESILETGTAFKFITEPVDPADPFKGKYIHLEFKENQLSSKDSTWIRNETVFVSIENDDEGFARATAISRAVPSDQYYVKANVSWFEYRNSVVHFRFPFDEFYMEESKAKPAELAHVDAQRDSIANNTFALVYVKDGESVLDNVFINNIPIADYVSE